jgi:hypothetical protein
MSRYCFKAAELVWKAGLASDKYVEKHYNGREENLAALAVAETVPALIDQNQVLLHVGDLTDSVPSSEKTLATHDYEYSLYSMLREFAARLCWRTLRQAVGGHAGGGAERG